VRVCVCVCVGVGVGVGVGGWVGGCQRDDKEKAFRQGVDICWIERKCRARARKKKRETVERETARDREKR